MLNGVSPSDERLLGLLALARSYADSDSWRGWSHCGECGQQINAAWRLGLVAGLLQEIQDALDGQRTAGESSSNS